ncbi:MAG: hypothetical protein BM555_03405 [Crocinitomix sp. MedPE-SWsnd]|nr:MAG: hypothetical protein BM555_03405 [Crocinitomix sp. MedPE-SWsnd]
MKCLIVLLTLVSLNLSSFGAQEVQIDPNIQTSSSDASNSGLDFTNATSSTQNQSTKKSSMMYYVIPAAAILLIALFSIAISKRLFFEK